MRRDVSSISEMRADIQMRTGYFYWAKALQNSVTIDIEGPLKEYWSSTERELRVYSPLQLPTSPPISDRGTQRLLSLKNTMVT